MKLEDSRSTFHNVDVPNVQCKEYRLLHVSDDGFLSLISEDFSMMMLGFLMEKIEKVFRTEKKAVKVVVLSSMDEEVGVDAKEVPLKTF